MSWLWWTVPVWVSLLRAWVSLRLLTTRVSLMRRIVNNSARLSSISRLFMTCWPWWRQSWMQVVHCCMQQRAMWISTRHWRISPVSARWHLRSVRRWRHSANWQMRSLRFPKAWTQSIATRMLMTLSRYTVVPASCWSMHVSVSIVMHVSPAYTKVRLSCRLLRLSVMWQTASMAST